MGIREAREMPKFIGGGGEDRTPDLGVMNPKHAYFSEFHGIRSNPQKAPI
jgi:hypothetical protein